MWSSAATAGANNNNNSKRVSCSPSKSSSSTCSSPSPFLPSSSVPKKSMEEVWKDINLASLHDPTSTTTTTTTTSAAAASFRGIVFQDFLASPAPNKNPPAAKGGSSAATTKRPPPPPPPPPPCACGGGSGEANNVFASPATVLSLNSGPDFQYLESSDLVNVRPTNRQISSTITPSFFSSLNSPFDALAPPSSVFPSFSKKRASENDIDDHNPGDRRYKRMMKNRESAARSRARRQAYTNELELEVTHLMEENAKLRRQQEKLLLAVAPAQLLLPKKKTLSRTSTAPF